MMSGERFRPVAWPVRQDLLAIALLALALRFTYLWAGLQTHDLSGVAMVASDSHVYTTLTAHYRGELVANPSYLLVACPGYPFLLAGLTAVFGPGLLPPVILNILFGALGAVVVYLLAATLIRSRKVAQLSGLWVALSFTGLSMSTSLLTDQPFYTLHALGLLLFLWGLESGRARWFIASGVASTLGAAVRPVSQLWPWIYILLALAWIRMERPRATPRVFAKSLWVPALMLSLTLAWSAHNARQHDLFTFSTNGARAAWAYLLADSVVDHTPGATIDSVRADWSSQVMASVDGHPPSEAVVHERIKSQVFAILLEHPIWVLDSFTGNVWQNTRAPNFYPEAQLPQWAGFWFEFRDLCHDRINPVLFGITFLGWILLLRRRLWWPALVLGLTYAYFVLISGFSFWQGSRLQFPGEMAGAILLSFAAERAWARWQISRYVRDGADAA